MTDKRKNEMPDDVADDKLHTLEYALGWAERFVCNEKVKNKDMQIWVEKLREAAIRAASTPPVPVDTIAVPREVLQGVRGALEFYTMFEDRPDEDPNEKFERIGKVFFKETRYLRPGKDCRLHSNEERQAVWDRWRDGKAVRAKDILASLDAVLSEGE